jgi:hypothetical protein
MLHYAVQVMQREAIIEYIRYNGDSSIVVSYNVQKRFWFLFFKKKIKQYICICKAVRYLNEQSHGQIIYCTVLALVFYSEKKIDQFQMELVNRYYQKRNIRDMVQRANL